jgi:hypothetical protein
VRSVVGEVLPPGVVLVHVRPDLGLAVRTGPARPVARGPHRTCRPSSSTRPPSRSSSCSWPSGGAPCRARHGHRDGGRRRRRCGHCPGAGRCHHRRPGRRAPCESGALHLRTPACARWSSPTTPVAHGSRTAYRTSGTWSTGRLPRHDVTLPVRPGPHGRCARGVEFGRTEQRSCGTGRDGGRRRRPAPAVRPHQARLVRRWTSTSPQLRRRPGLLAAGRRSMQRGEGLHLLNLVAGNLPRHGCTTGSCWSRRR